MKLTAWYLLLFTILIAIFTYLTFEAKQSAFVRVYTVINTGAPGSAQVKEFTNKFDEFNHRFQQRIYLFDAGLLIAGGFLAYFLSGKTLAPIQTMLEEQQAFAGDVSHSLRTPLTTMSVELETYRRTHKNIPPELNSLFNSLQEEMLSMTALIGGLLALVRSGTDPLKSRFTAVDLVDVVERVVQRMSPLLKTKHQRLTVKVPKEAMVRGESDQLKQVVMILVDNAIKYSGDKALIGIYLKKGRQTTTLTISDTGRGIAPKDLPYIFHRYYRGKTATKGSGLGLAIAAKIIGHHNGTIKAKSTLGKGSAFTVTLPLTH